MSVPVYFNTTQFVHTSIQLTKHTLERLTHFIHLLNFTENEDSKKDKQVIEERM